MYCIVTKSIAYTSAWRHVQASNTRFHTSADDLILEILDIIDIFDDDFFI